jgi:hypothetical protein
VTSVNSMGPEGREAAATGLTPLVLVATREGSGGALFGAGTLDGEAGAGTTIFAGDGTSGRLGDNRLQLLA